MKIIFSRKGFDSTAGGFPSPIFPDGRMFSIPIPSTNDNHCFQDINFSYNNENISTIIRMLTNIPGERSCHFDPMLLPESNEFALGQYDRAEGHLKNQGVGVGDVFLFYGWFKNVIKNGNKWQYDNEARDIHQIWGWLKVQSVFDLKNNTGTNDAKKRYPFLVKHPHLTGINHGKNERVYVSKTGGLCNYDVARCLTDMKEYNGRATWRLPKFFNHPEAFSFLKNFNCSGNDVVINYRGYGQEFVLNLENVKSESDRISIKNYLNENIGIPLDCLEP